MYRIFIVIGFAAVLASCHSPNEPQAVGNFPLNVSIIIQNNCLGGSCHSGRSSTNDSLDLSSWETMIQGGNLLNEVIPFTAVNSHLFGHLNTNTAIGPVIAPTMPYARNPLSASDQLTFFNWINQGAKSADGKIPYSSVAKKIFVPNENDNMISVIDAETERWVRIISTGESSEPAAIAMMPDNSSLIAAMDGTGAIRKYDVASYTMLGEFQSNLNPGGIAITSDGSKGYVTDDKSGFHDFGVFDPVNMKMKKTISTPLLIDPDDAGDVVISPDGKYAYLCGAGSDNVIRIDTKTDSVTGCLALGPDVPIPAASDYTRKYFPRKILLSADSKTMYVSCYNTQEIVVFNLTNDSIISRIPVQYNPWGLALTPDGSELWAAALGDSAVFVISTLTNSVITRIDNVSQNPRSITITPDGAFAYVACELSAGGAHHHATGGLPPSSYVVIDRKEKKIISINELPAFSTGVAIGYR